MSESVEQSLSFGSSYTDIAGVGREVERGHVSKGSVGGGPVGHTL